MSERKANKDAVKDYHAKLVNIMVRVPAANEEAGIKDFKKMIAERAASLGLSVNAYILGLIEEDIGIKIPTGLRDCK